MTKKQAISKTIAHWKRMIAWAKKQKPDEIVSASGMYAEIKENWSGEYCALCNEHRCPSCPLFVKFGSCNSDGNSWRTVNFSPTWGEWARNAEEMLKALRSLQPRKKGR